VIYAEPRKKQPIKQRSVRIFRTESLRVQITQCEVYTGAHNFIITVVTAVCDVLADEPCEESQNSPQGHRAEKKEEVFSVALALCGEPFWGGFSMKAIVISRLGGPEVLEVRDVPDPTPENGEELIQGQAGGLNFADVLTAKGGYPGTPTPPLIAGREYCGIRQRDGQRVMGYKQWAAFAEYTTGRPELLWPVPESWSAEEGAAFPVNYFTAWFAYWKAGLLNPQIKNSRVLIHAVAGGVGTASVQIGKLLGMEMYGTSSSEEKLARIKQLGLQHCINYKEHDYEQAVKDLTRGEGVDAVFEMLGGEHTNRSVRCLRDFGRVIVYGSATGEKAALDTRLLYAKGASVHGLWLTYLSANRGLMQQAWGQLSTWISQGHLRPVIGGAFAMEQVREAYCLLAEGRNFGKVVIRIP